MENAPSIEALLERCEWGLVGDFKTLADLDILEGTPLIIRNASYFGPIEASKTTPTISLLQDIMTEGPGRNMQEKVLTSAWARVFNSAFTLSHYKLQEAVLDTPSIPTARVIPLPVDFSVFEPGNSMGLQTAYSLPNNCVCWIGAQSEIKGWDIFLKTARMNPDISFVGVFKDSIPVLMPPNMRAFHRLPTEELVKVIGACRVGLCTSRMESQHLAGIEMGACGLPMIAPPVGVYYEHKDIPGCIVTDTEYGSYSHAIRVALEGSHDPVQVRGHWRKDFDIPVIKAAWTKIVEEVENVKPEVG